MDSFIVDDPLFLVNIYFFCHNLLNLTSNTSTVAQCNVAKLSCIMPHGSVFMLDPRSMAIFLLISD